MKAVIMAGGLGTRLFPLTQNTPKPLLPVANRPMLGWATEFLGRHGFSDVVLTAGYGAEAIMTYLRGGQEHGVRCLYSVEKAPLGTAGGLRLARRYLRDQSEFLVTSGDCLYNLPLSEAVAFHRRKAALATIVLTWVDDRSRYGSVEAAGDGRVLAFREKDPLSAGQPGLVNTGIYVLSRDIFRFIPPGRAYDFGRDLFPRVVAAGEPVYAIRLSGYWLDMGVPAQYLQGNLDVIGGRTGLPVPGREVSPGIYVEDGAAVDPRATLLPPSLVGRGAIVEADAVVGPQAVVGAGSLVHRAAEVRHAVVLPGTDVAAGEIVSLEVAGPGLRLPVPEITAATMEA